MQVLKQIQTTVTKQLPVNRFRPTENEPVQTRLCTCGACDTTYIASEMHSCPECQAVVEEVSTGSELGYTSA